LRDPSDGGAYRSTSQYRSYAPVAPRQGSGIAAFTPQAYQPVRYKSNYYNPYSRGIASMFAPRHSYFFGPRVAPPPTYPTEPTEPTYDTKPTEDTNPTVDTDTY
jgi:hypothetical protein